MAWVQMQMASKALRMPVDLQILLPEQVGEQPLSTLYLLHGAGGGASDWVLYSALPRLVRELPLAVVLPAGNNSFYANTAYGQNYLDYITEELPSCCERWMALSTEKEHRFVAGCGMGGYGALAAALRAPERFAAAAAFYPILQPAEGDAPLTMQEIFPQNDADLFGRLPAAEPGTALWLWDGGETLAQSERFAAAAAEHGFDCRCDALPCGSGWTGYGAAVAMLIERIMKEVR